MGIPDPYQMLDEMPTSLFDDWIAYYAVEPWGNQNVQLASILSVLTGKPVHHFGVPRKPMTQEEIRLGFKRMGLID